MNNIITLVLVFLSIAFIFAKIVPFVLRRIKKFHKFQQKKIEKATVQLEDMFVDVQAQKMQVLFIWVPVAAVIFLYLLFHNLLFCTVGAALSILIPDFVIKSMQAERRRKFRQQLPEVIFTISSSMRAGLSLQQALEVVAADMPAPASQEFGITVKAYKMGMDLRDALARIKARMESNEMKLLVMLFNISGETGGDVIRLLDTLADTIRQREKLSEKITTLTLQGRLQAYIMGVLPIVFVFVVRTTRKDYFDILFNDAVGRVLIFSAAGAWLAAMFLLYKFSKIEVY